MCYVPEIKALEVKGIGFCVAGSQVRSLLLYDDTFEGPKFRVTWRIILGRFSNVLMIQRMITSMDEEPKNVRSWADDGSGEIYELKPEDIEDLWETWRKSLLTACVWAIYVINYVRFVQ